MELSSNGTLRLFGPSPAVCTLPRPPPRRTQRPVSLGQLKHTFAFDLTGDSDGDGIPDAEDTSPLDPDRDGDGFNDGEDKMARRPEARRLYPAKVFRGDGFERGIGSHLAIQERPALLR